MFYVYMLQLAAESKGRPRTSFGEENGSKHENGAVNGSQNPALNKPLGRVFLIYSAFIRLLPCELQPWTKLLRHFNTILNFEPCNHRVQKEQIRPPPPSPPGTMLFWLNSSGVHFVS